MGTARKHTGKTESLDLRMTSEAKHLIEQAAALSGMPTTSFIVNGAIRKAKRVIQEAEIIQLTNRDRDRLLAALDDADAKPNAVLRRAAKRHKSMIG